MVPAARTSQGRVILIPTSRSVPVKVTLLFPVSRRTLERMAMVPFFPVTFCSVTNEDNKGLLSILIFIPIFPPFTISIIFSFIIIKHC